MKANIKSKVPLIFLIVVSLWWWFYYASSNAFNGFGAEKHEWLFMLDTLLVLPILCFICEDDKQKALLKFAMLCSSAVFIGSVIIPEQNKVLFQYLESGRYVVLAIVLLLELTAVITVVLAVRGLLAINEDPDIALQKPIDNMLGTSALSTLLQFEGRVWTFALLASHIKPMAYAGEYHFFYDKKDGARSNLVGFLALMVIELPLVHLLIHFLCSSTAANIVTGLTLFGLVFFFAEYKAVGKRPISISGNNIIVRYGLYPSLTISIHNIAAISANTGFIKRSRYIKRFNYAGVPNVEILLHEPMNGRKAIYLGVNSPCRFIHCVKQVKTKDSFF